MKIKIIKFGTSSCMQCKLQDRELMKVVRAPVERVNAEEDEKLANVYNIASVPTTLIVNEEDGKELVRFTGLVQSDILQKSINEFIN